MNIEELCLKPYEHHAVVTDTTRQAVIDCLRACWGRWDYPTRIAIKHAIGTWVDNDTRTMHEALEKIPNEVLAEILYSVYDNGDLNTWESDGLVFQPPSPDTSRRMQ